MSTTDDASPAFPVVRLWERTGAHGTFMSGVWGGARVLIVRNQDRSDEGDADWLLLLGPHRHPQPRNRERTNHHDDRNEHPDPRPPADERWRRDHGDAAGRRIRAAARGRPRAGRARHERRSGRPTLGEVLERNRLWLAKLQKAGGAAK